MTGEALQAYVFAGDTWYKPGDVPSAEHARLVTNPKAWGGTVPEFGDSEPAAAAGPFDPAEHNLAQVKDYLDGLGDDDAGRVERDRVVEAERARGDHARKGIVGD